MIFLIYFHNLVFHYKTPLPNKPLSVRKRIQYTSGQKEITFGLANHDIDLNVANLLVKSPRSHGRQSDPCSAVAEAEEDCCPSATSPLRFNSITPDW